jgi:hypothetical protein
MTIVATNGGGSVGIGTNSPSKTLDIGFADYGSPGIRFTHTDPDGIERIPSGHESYYTGLEAVIERYADKDTRYTSGNVPEVTHRINLGYSDDYYNSTGFYPQHHEMHFEVMNNTGESAATATLDRIMTLRGDGRVGIGTTSPTAVLDVNGVARLSTIQRTAYMEELSKTFYFVSGSSGTNKAVLLEINVDSSADNDQREFAGTIDLHIVAQRTSSSHNVDCFNGQLHFVAGWNEQVNFWQVKEFIQENKAVHTSSYRVLESIPTFRYKYIDRKLQIYVQYNYNTIGARHSYVAKVTSDRGASGDVSIVDETTLMASGTDVQAVSGVCYGVTLKNKLSI